MPNPAQRRHPRRGRRRSERTRLWRLVGPAVLVAALVATTLVVSLGSADSPAGSRDRSPGRPHRHTRSVQSSGTRRPGAGTRRAAGERRAAGFEARRAKRARRRRPGALPQTEGKPTARTVTFRREMSTLWRAIVSNDPAQGTSAFFPKGAYLQLKAIEGASGDYSERLFHDYALDIDAAHALLGANARSAQLVRVEVPPSYAHWIPPDVCYNRVGYWETPNSRVIYRENGRLRSFGIASLISWRGVWYVVHLGAILRAGDEGVVDAPSAGIGVAEPSSTC